MNSHVHETTELLNLDQLESTKINLEIDCKSERFSYQFLGGNSSAKKIGCTHLHITLQ